MESELKIEGCDIYPEIFYSEALFLPAFIAITNALYFRATGEVLITVDGAIKKCLEAPFGLELEGDINLSSFEMPIGLLEQCIKTTLRVIQPIYKNEMFKEFSAHLFNEVLHEYESKEPIPMEIFINNDLLIGTV
ncbi:hypothetical protein KJB35_20790 [Vibrio sp. D431a]|nr:hypothetical protein [Vibrio sp. D431a]